MSKDARPPKYEPPAATVPAALVRSSVPGHFKCMVCGKTLPEDIREPDLPDEWARCVPCHLSSERHNPHRDVTEPVAARRFETVIDEWRRQHLPRQESPV